MFSWSRGRDFRYVPIAFFRCLWQFVYMKIVVCVKFVPDAQSVRRIEAGTVVRGEEDSINDLDENAIEAAVSAVERHGGEVIALTMGPQGSEGAVRRALQMGADRAVMVSDELLANSDVIRTSTVLAKAIEKIAADGPVDMVVCGLASLDGMTSMMPASLATSLGWPCLAAASTLGVEDNAVTISKVADGFNDVLTAPFPVVVSVNDEVNQPRYPGFKQMMAAKKKKVEVWSLSDLPGGDAIAQQTEPYTRVLEARQKPPRDAEATIITDSGDAAAVLASYLKDKGFVVPEGE